MKKSYKIILPILVIAIIFVSAGIVFKNTAAAEDKIFEGVYISNVNVGGMSANNAVKLLEEKFNKNVTDKKIVISYENQKYTIDYKKLKAHYDIESAVNKAFSYGKNGNIIEKTLNRFKIKNSNYNINLEFTADTSTVSSYIKKISKDINMDPVDAKISYNGSFHITSDVPGRKVNETKLKGLIEDAVNPDNKEEKVEVPVDKVEASVKGDMLSKINAKISSFSTKFSTADSNRAGNIRIAAETINGTIVMPGGIYSMNKALGPRVKSKGYTEAPVIINGTHVPGLAGGICQATTTVYNAALLANFQIISRKPHQLKVGYVPAGRDATISGDAIDMKFKNTNKYPIYIQTIVSSGNIRVNIYGANEHPGQSVEITSEVYEKVPATTQYINDETLEVGKQVVDEKSSTGYKSRTYRKVYENGQLVKTELISKDYYKPVNGKIRVGTKAAAQTTVPVNENSEKQN